MNGGSRPYEHPKIPKEGKVGVTEMWAHAVGYIMLYEYTGSNMGLYPVVDEYWFKPTVVWELYKLGLSLNSILGVMQSDVVTLQTFKERLVEKNKQYEIILNTTFSTYLNM